MIGRTDNWVVLQWLLCHVGYVLEAAAMSNDPLELCRCAGQTYDGYERNLLRATQRPLPYRTSSRTASSARRHFQRIVRRVNVIPPLSYHHSSTHDIRSSARLTCCSSPDNHPKLPPTMPTTSLPASTPIERDSTSSSLLLSSAYHSGTEAGLMMSPLLPASDNFARLGSGMFPSLSPNMTFDVLNYRWDNQSPQPPSTAVPQTAIREVSATYPSPAVSHVIGSADGNSAATSSASSSSSPSALSTATFAAPLPSSSAVTTTAVSVSVSQRRMSDTTSTSMPPIRRRRSDGVTAKEESAMRKRMKQRECDIQRREKENSGYKRLYALLTAQRDRHSEADGDDDDDEGAADRSKLKKASILRQSAERIEQLQRSVGELMEACACYGYSTTAGSTDTPLSPHICSHPPLHVDELPPSESALLAARLQRASLSHSFSTESSLAIVLLHVPSGLLVDASDLYLSHTGWQRADIVGRRMFQPLKVTLADPLLATDPHSSAGVHDNRVLVEGKDGRRVTSKQEPQYEKSMRQLQQLYTGAVDTIDALWRGPLADGKKSATLNLSVTLTYSQHSRRALLATTHTGSTRACVCACVCVCVCLSPGTSVEPIVGWASGRSVTGARVRARRRYRCAESGSLATV